jgi:hypothetical protein
MGLGQHRGDRIADEGRDVVGWCDDANTHDQGTAVTGTESPSCPSTVNTGFMRTICQQFSKKARAPALIVTAGTGGATRVVTMTWCRALRQVETRRRPQNIFMAGTRPKRSRMSVLVGDGSVSTVMAGPRAGHDGGEQAVLHPRRYPDAYGDTPGYDERKGRCLRLFTSQAKAVRPALLSRRPFLPAETPTRPTGTSR